MLILAIGIAALGFYFWQKKAVQIPKPAYTQAYRLVQEKISQSAIIAITLPPKIDKLSAKSNIEFTPEIKGDWLGEKPQAGIVLAAENSETVYFKPKEKLNLNRYYLAELATPDGGLVRADFLAVEDPEIIAIFPQVDSEAPENSEITIVFNRPMVPLTTLAELEEKDVPVEITPETQGRFKWITTRNLQFIPKERLIRSANYKVNIKPGLVSTDGLAVSGKETSFITRKLRYFNIIPNGEDAVYNQPVYIYFNQPVDLEKTKSEISVINNSTGKEISFIVEYEKNTAGSADSQKEKPMGFLHRARDFLADLSLQLGLNFSSKNKEEQGENKSVLKIYNQKDRFGREKFWDFDNSYTLTIKKVYPLEGDIILNESRSASFSVTNPVASFRAESERTQWADLDFFDPQGKIAVNFYEEINLDKSRIFAPHLKEIVFGQKCKDENLYPSENCDKVEDRKKIYLTFKDGEIGKSESLEVNFEKIVNSAGQTLNKEPIRRQVISYPEFKILRTSPSPNSTGASLQEFVICSNSPVLAPPKDDFKKYLKLDNNYQINSWGGSWRVNYVSGAEPCQIRQFHTSISYGLMPQTSYSLVLDLEDVFSQKTSYSFSFSTGDMPDQDLNFYQFQLDYNVSSPARTQLTFGTKNMEYVNLEICKLDANNFLSYLENRLSREKSSDSINCQQIIRDRVELPKKYWVINYFKTNIKDYFSDPVGHYILTFFHPNYRISYRDRGLIIQKQAYERSYLTITNLAVAKKTINPQSVGYWSVDLNLAQLGGLNNLFWVTDLSNLEPVAGARVFLYQKSSLQLAGQFLTDNQGIAKTPVISDLSGAIVTNGQDSTVIPRYESNLNYGQPAFSAQKLYLYTDKPIYRPGQEVFIKGIYRLGYDGNYEIYQGRKINFKVYNSKGEEFFNNDLTVSDFGTIDTKLILDKGAPLGTYRMCADLYNCDYFDVQEYLPAAFAVGVKSDKEEYISKDAVNLEISADYYFGVPLEAGEVEYTISSQNYYFDKYSDGYFNFGSSWYYWQQSFGDRFVLRGKTSLSSGGKAKISEIIDLEKLFKNEDDRKSKIIIFDITVKNNQGQSVSSQKSFVLHAGEFYLGLNSDKSFLGKDEKFNIKIKSVGTQGKETKVKNATLSLFRVNWVYSKRQEATGGYSYNWEKKRELVEKHDFDTDSSGNYSKEMKIVKEGEYEAEVSARDGRKNLVRSFYNLYVYGEGQVTVQPTKDTQLGLEAQRTSLNVGDEANILIKSPYAEAKALIAVERGKVFNYEVREIKGNLYNYNFQIKEEYVPNIFVSVLLQSKTPEIKFGQVEFKINTKEKELNIEVKSNKTAYLPGEEVTLDILAADSEGRPVSAELSVAVVDLSVLALKGNPKKNPLVFFYSGFPLTVQTGSNLKNILEEIEISGTKGGGGGEGLAKKARGVFRETAFWQAVLKTDNQGRAQAKFTLPDNLTTWQTETLGLTKDTKLGVDYQEFTTRKELMAVPLKPRFVIPGDVFYIGAKIFNQSKDRQKLDVSFESESLALEDSDHKEVSLKSGETDTIYFKVQAPSKIERGSHKFTISAKNKNLEDTVIQEINIAPNDTYETVATANYTTDAISKEYVFLPDNIVKDKGGLSVKSSATLAVFLSDALKYLIQYPYGCSEQIASKLSSIAIVKKGLNLPNLGDKFQLPKVRYGNNEYSIEEAVEIGLNEIYNNQDFSGGFHDWRGWRYDEKPDFYLTLHVVDALYNLSSAGFSVNQSKFKLAADYLRTEISKGKWQYESEFDYKNRLILATFTLSKLSDLKSDLFLRERVIKIANDISFLNDQVSMSALAYLAIILTGDFDKNLQQKVFKNLDNRINIDARGAFLEPGKNSLWYYYETPIKDTALYLKFLTASKSSNPMTEKVLRWILNSRQKDGAWGSTNNTITVIDALTDFLKWKRETESDFDLELLINSASQGSFRFNKETILNQFNRELALDNLKFNENNILHFSKTDNNKLPNAYYYDMALKYYLPIDQIPSRDEGFSISREFYKTDDKGNKNPLKEAKVGDVLRVHWQITVPKSGNFVMVEDFIPAGMEIVNLELATEQKSLLLEDEYKKDREYWKAHFDRSLYPDFQELHDDRAFVFKNNLAPGVYEFDYYVRVLTKGTFNHLPAQVSEMYFPENFGRTAGGYFEIK